MKTRIVTIKAGSVNATEQVRQAKAASVITDSRGNGMPLSTTSKHVSFEVPSDFEFSA